MTLERSGLPSSRLQPEAEELSELEWHDFQLVRKKYRGLKKHEAQLRFSGIQFSQGHDEGDCRHAISFMIQQRGRDARQMRVNDTPRRVGLKMTCVLDICQELFA